MLDLKTKGDNITEETLNKDEYRVNKEYFYNLKEKIKLWEKLEN